MHHVGVVFVIGGCLALTATPATWAQEPERSTPESTTVVILGTASHPEPSAAGPATAVLVGSRIFLFDAGAGVERQLSAAGLKTNGVSAAFLTSLVIDHTLGYPDLLLNSWLNGRSEPLEVYGPPGTNAMTEHILAAYAEDISARTRRQIPSGEFLGKPPGSERASVHEVRGGLVYDKEGVRITAIRVPFWPHEYAFGYRIETPQRTIMISGGGVSGKAFEEAAREVDVLVHEVYASADINAGARALVTFAQTSDSAVGALAARAAPKLLILTHIIPGPRANQERLLANVVSGGFKGHTVIAHDLMRF